MAYRAKVGYQFPEGVFNAGSIVPDEVVGKYKLANVEKFGDAPAAPASSGQGADPASSGQGADPADDGVDSAAAASEAKKTSSKK